MVPFLAALAPFAPLIGGAIGAIGSLLAPKPEPTTTTSTIDLKRLRSDAEAAGFNPLTIIRGGGLAGYGSQTTSAAPDMRLSNAFMTFGSAVSQWSYDPNAGRRGALEMALMEAQIADFGRRSAPANMSFQTPKAVTAGDDYTVFGVNWKRSPWFSNAQEIEDRHGDIAGSVYGIATLPADMIYTGWANGGAAAWNNVLGGIRDYVANEEWKPIRKPVEITVRGGAQ